MKLKGAQILLSAFLVFHLAAIFILPNPDSILFRETEHLFVNYGNLVGVNTTWRFFSPNPLIRMLEYEVVIDEDGNTDPVIYRYPESVKVEGSRESYNRQLNVAMYMMASVDHLRTFLTPFLCARHPEALALSYYSVAREFPTVESAQRYSSDRDSLEKLVRQRLTQIECERGAHD